MTNWIRKILGRGAHAAPDPLAGLAPEARDLITQVRAKNLTYLSEKKLACLAHACRELEADRVPGVFIEAGCALGGSSILLARLKQADRPMRVYDVFGMIPPPTDDDPPEVHARYQTIKDGASQGLTGMSRTCSPSCERTWRLSASTPSRSMSNSSRGCCRTR